MKDVIIIGAGAAGLMAGKTLAENGLEVMVVEARDRIGGRIQTLSTDDWGYPAEAGAEFVHGNLKVTLDLLKEAGIAATEVDGDMWKVDKGECSKDEAYLEEQALVIEKLKDQKSDISIADFLQQEFSGTEYAELRQSLLGYVEGYYAGDPELTSSMAFLDEWESEEQQQYRPANGYGALLKYMASSITNHGGSIHLNVPVTSIHWQQGNVLITDEHLNQYQAKKVLITVPVGVWTADEHQPGSIAYHPGLPQKKEAAANIGYGQAIKILIRFSEAFYNNLLAGKESTGFIFSDAAIGTWWTQAPLSQPILTGWLAGPKAYDLRHSTNDIIYDRAIDSLAVLFSISKKELETNIVRWEVYNWSADVYARGAYGYTTLTSREARKIVAQPVEQTLFFGGEALYEGTETGTVEAALTSGITTAQQILGSM